MPAPEYWARQAYLLGYAEVSDTLTRRAITAGRMAEQMASECESPRLTRLIVEAGRTEGKRSSRESDHRKLYEYHGAALAKALAAIIARLDIDVVAAEAVEHAQQQAAAGADPVTRRRTVRDIVATAIATQIHADDRKTLDDLNADGWANATAYGNAEATSTPPGGGPPEATKIAAAAAVYLSQIDLETATAASVGWTQLELQTIAMGVALAAGDAKELGIATRAVKAALVDTGRATRVYADQLHAAVTQAYINRTQTQTPGVLYDWLTADDPCDVCEDNADNGPYAAADVPDYPPHPGCLCDVEVSADSSVLVNA